MCSRVISRLAAAAFVAAAANGAFAGAAGSQTTSHDGHARFDVAAKALDLNRIRFTIGCPSGGTLTCQGSARLTTRRLISTPSGRRVVTIATAEFDGLAPGERVTLVRKVRRAARSYVRRRGEKRALGKVLNDLDSGVVQTLTPVTIAGRGGP